MGGEGVSLLSAALVLSLRGEEVLAVIYIVHKHTPAYSVRVRGGM